MNPLYVEVAERARKRCEYCRAPQAAFNFPFEVEHVIPLASHGAAELDNLALSCRSCNAFKGARQAAQDPTTREHVPLFHRRHDPWLDHFRFSPDGSSLEGLTPTGRATIDALRLNSEEQRTARVQWRRLGLFP